MSQFTLLWNNDAVEASPNSVGQRASYRPKSAGGAWITAGFFPSNDLTQFNNTCLSPDIPDNIIYEFKVECLCDVGGPTMNDNGIQEAIIFSCLNPVTGVTDTSSSISVDASGLDILKAKFILRKASDNSIVYDSGKISKAGDDSISTSKTGLTPGTNYYWQIEYYAQLGSVEVVSSSTDYLSAPCSPYPVTTTAPAVCNPITSITVSSIEIP